MAHEGRAVMLHVHAVKWFLSGCMPGHSEQLLLPLEKQPLPVSLGKAGACADGVRFSMTLGSARRPRRCQAGHSFWWTPDYGQLTLRQRHFARVAVRLAPPANAPKPHIKWIDIAQ